MRSNSKYLVCRLCLSYGEVLVDICEDKSDPGFEVKETIQDILHLEVVPGGDLPWLVCRKCIAKLEEVSNFKFKSISSNGAFVQRFSRPRSSPRVTPPATTLPQPQSNGGLAEETVTDDYFPEGIALKDESVDISEREEEQRAERVPRLDSWSVAEGEDPLSLESSSKGLSEETVTDDYIPEGGGPGCVQVKEERVDPEDCPSYDEVDEERLVSSEQGVSVGAFGGTHLKHRHIQEAWGTTGDGVSDGQHQQERLQHHGDSYSKLQTSQGMGRGQEGRLLILEGNSLPVGMPLAGQQSPTQEEFVCPQCGKSFANLCYMNKHIRVTHKREVCERKYECEVCKMSFAKRGNLERHATVHKGVRSFSCERCGKAFFHHSELQAHLSNHLKVSPFTCDYCQRGFGHKLHLIEHINRHTGGKPFGCRSCDKQFVSVKYLKVHEKIHEPNPSYRCEECNKTFTNRFYFLGHQRKHSGELFKCLECGKKFAHKNNLKQHQALHREDGGFICEVCGKKFHNKNHLRVHTMVHTGERPFECEYCNKRFLVASHLRVHLKRHTGERPFYCDVCGKGFVQKSHYVNHVRVHTGERPYACTECSKAFCQRQQLHQHMKTHNKGKVLVGGSVKQAVS
ncbi:zinc finger protein ZFP2-like isoform X2 [Hetaerina americana]|uniref:zinc finger protein ZFP2-like isoform X2 n=1 Tax=Hetaerina americana TaxID=62018 RepID=UPI003A7F1F58